MHSIFNITPSVHQGIPSFPEWGYIKQGLTRNLATVVKFYRNNPMMVEAEHFLVRLIQNINVPLSQNIERYYSNVDSISMNVSMALKMTSSIFKGDMFKGVFYGECPEVLIAHDENFDPVEADKNWENLCPVKSLWHPMSDLQLALPNGKVNGTETGIAIITINIPLLMVQYRAFRNNEDLLTDGTDIDERSLMQFIHMYVLPNMLFSQLDVAVFNRIDKLQQNLPRAQGKQTHPFYLTDFSQKVDSVQERLLNNIAKSSRDFTTILRSIPLVTKHTTDDIVTFPEFAPTRQVVWALFISRISVIRFLFGISYQGPGQKTQNEVNFILREIARYQNDNTLRSILPSYLFNEINNQIEAIKNLA